LNAILTSWSEFNYELSFSEVKSLRTISNTKPMKVNPFYLHNKHCNFHLYSKVPMQNKEAE